MLRKQLCEKSFGTVWDDLAYFCFFDVPVLFPPSELWIQAGRAPATQLIPTPQIVSRAERANSVLPRSVLVIAFFPFLELVELTSFQLATRNITSTKRAPKPPYLQGVEPCTSSPVS